MSESLSLLYPELPALHKGELAPLLNKFERMALDPDSPIRAIRRTAARAGEYAAFPEAVNPKLRKVLAARGIESSYSVFP